MEKKTAAWRPTLVEASIACMCVCAYVPDKILNQLACFNEICYENSPL
jgi:hypothetical protein